MRHTTISHTVKRAIARHTLYMFEKEYKVLHLNFALESVLQLDRNYRLILTNQPVEYIALSYIYYQSKQTIGITLKHTLPLAQYLLRREYEETNNK
jgi:hypothetical protein